MIIKILRQCPKYFYLIMLYYIFQAFFILIFRQILITVNYLFLVA